MHGESSLIGVAPATAGMNPPGRDGALCAARPSIHILKRVFDLFSSAVALVLLSPLWLAIALAVKLDSRGPVLFRQARMGRAFRPFLIYKFRTMVADAPRLGGQLTAGDRDPRITRIGRFLRRWKLDELPQLLNIVKGDMSFVGPRPEVPRYVEMFRDDYAVILAVRPGITDSASIRFLDEGKLLAAATDPEETYVRQILPAKIALAKQYIAHQSFLTDMRLICQTVWHTARI